MKVYCILILILFLTACGTQPEPAVDPQLPVYSAAEPNALRSDSPQRAIPLGALAPNTVLAFTHDKVNATYFTLAVDGGPGVTVQTTALPNVAGDWYVPIPPLTPGSHILIIAACNADGCASAVPLQVPDTSNPALVAATNLKAVCSADGKQFTVSWSPVPSATVYYLRVDYLPNNANALWNIVPGVDFYEDNLPGPTFTGAITPNQPYAFWVHGATTANGAAGPVARSTFTCAKVAQVPKIPITARILVLP